MNYKFIKLRDSKNTFDNSVIEHAVEAEDLLELIEAFEDFLKGSGFVFDGHLALVEDEE